MEKKNIYPKIEKDMDFKSYLCYYSSLYQPVDINKQTNGDNNSESNKDPIFQLLEFEKIKNFYDKPNFLIFIYFNKEKVHLMLYDKDELIHIDSIKNEDNYYFISLLYLTLLIEDNKDTINYSYPFELINIIYDIQTKQEKKDNLKKLILSKIIITLITNYEQNENNVNVDNKLISQYKNYNNEIINDNENLLKKYKLNKEDILSKKIDEIYISIIKQLIIEDELNESEKTKNIMKYLDLKNFNITKTIFDELRIILNEKENYIKKYIINRFEDIFNEEIITFYYVLFKYILKNSLYIYQIPFLLRTRNNILKYIKKNIDKLKTNLENNSNNIDKIIYVLNYFIEFEYYNKLSLKKKDENSNISGVYSSYNNNSNMVSNSQSNYNEVGYSSSGPFGNSYLNEKQRTGRSLGLLNDQQSEYDIVKNIFGKEKPYQILENSKFNFHTNRKGKDPPIICDEIYIGTEKTNYSLDEIEKFSFDDIKKKFSSNPDVKFLEENYIKFIDFLNKIIKKIESEFSFRYKFKFTLQFKTNFIENHKFKIDCIYTAYIPNEDFLEYKDENIIEKGASNGITLLLSEITNDAYNDLEYED
jgi:hypothetical protein